MTTILADWHKGIIVTDSNCTDNDRVWSIRKVHRYQGVLYAFSGEVLEATEFLEWIKEGRVNRPPSFASSCCLALSAEGLYVYNNSVLPEKIAKGIEAIGTGAKAVMCTYEALNFEDPIRAVRIVCKHDNGSRLPIRTYHLNNT